MSRRWGLGVLLWTVLLLSGASEASAQPQVYRLDGARSSIHFDAKATMHAFGGDAKAMEGNLVWDAAAQTIGAGTVVKVPVMQLTTGMIKRDHSMRRMFETKDYPEIEFAVQKAVLAGPGRYRLEGVLKIRQVERSVAIDVTEREISPDALEVSGATQLSIDDFNLKPPVAFGMMRVLPDVQLRFKSVWKKA